MRQHQRHWRAYQSRLQKKRRLKRQVRQTITWSAVLPLICFCAYGLTASLSGMTCRPSATSATISTRTAPAPVSLSKAMLDDFLDKTPPDALTSPSLTLRHGDEKWLVDTMISEKIQSEADDIVKTEKNRQKGRPRYVAIVAMDPETGGILALSGADSTGNIHPCISGVFPAASVFKIISSAAAIETCGLTPKSRIPFNGEMYTLYKSQIQKKTNRYSNYYTLQRAFAQSVNPVFGKLGAFYIQPEDLGDYASAFGFNRHIEFSFPLPQSEISISGDPYHRAELASGFNRETRLTPVHAAMIAATAVNGGKLMAPTLVGRVSTQSGRTCYEASPMVLDHPISTGTANHLKSMMAATVRFGTSKKTFRGYRRDRVLKALNIGGKTGSIFNGSHDVRFDWFVGYAEEKKGHKKLALAVVVGHEKYITTKASQMARTLIKTYFTPDAG